MIFVRIHLNKLGMKKISCILLFLFAIISCKKDQTVIEEKPIAQETVKLSDYLIDAKYLHIRQLNTNQSHPNYQSIDLDTTEINKIYGLIKAVYELKTPERDTIFNVHKIHFYHTIKLSEVTIHVPDIGPGMQNLMSGIIPTGNLGLDSLLLKYQLYTHNVYTLLSPNGSHYISLKTKKELNIPALENKLKTIEGVMFVSIYSTMGDSNGNYLSLSYQGNKAILDFSYGFGDCPSGCGRRINWSFEIENNIAKFIAKKIIK